MMRMIRVVLSMFASAWPICDPHSTADQRTLVKGVGLDDAGPRLTRKAALLLAAKGGSFPVPCCSTKGRARDKRETKPAAIHKLCFGGSATRIPLVAFLMD